MSLALAGTIIGGGLAQGLLNRTTALENTKRTIKANKELAEYQYSKDLEMWERNNEYNSPALQMERLRNAGLNPNLVYGSGAVANTSGSMPKYNAPRVEYDIPTPVDIPGMIGMYQSFALNQAQIDNVNAQTAKTEADAIIQQAIAGYAPETAKYNALGVKQGVEQQIKNLELSNLEIGMKQIEKEWLQGGLTKNDNVALRLLMRTLNSMGVTPDTIAKMIKDPNFKKEVLKMMLEQNTSFRSIEHLIPRKD